MRKRQAGRKRLHVRFAMTLLRKLGTMAQTPLGSDRDPGRFFSTTTAPRVRPLKSCFHGHSASDRNH